MGVNLSVWLSIIQSDQVLFSLILFHNNAKSSPACQTLLASGASIDMFRFIQVANVSLSADLI